MSQTYHSEDIKIVQCDVEWRKAQITQVNCVADVAGSLAAKYFKLPVAATDATKYFVWYDSGSSTAPTVTGYTAIHVTYSMGASAALIASLTAAAIVGTTGALHKVTAKDLVLTITNKADGVCTPAFDGTAPTGFAITTVAYGNIVDMGLMDGDLDFKISASVLALKAQQTGAVEIGQIYQGAKIDAISIKLKEQNIARLQSLIAPTGSTVTPMGGTSVTGQGTARVGASLTTAGGKLILHPTANLSSDLSGDFCFWLATPTFEGMNFSGEKESLQNISFSISVDFTKNANINQWIIGDWSQALDAV